jgi:hypothetical protein
MAAQVTAGRFRLASPSTAYVLGAVGVVLLAAAVVVGVASHDLTVGGNVASMIVFLAYGGVGFVVARRQPGNPVGWVLLGFALLLGLEGDASLYAVVVYRLGHGGLPFGPAAVVLGQLWAPAIVLLPLAVLLFPDGALTAGWRWVLRAYLAVGACWPASIYVVTIATVTGHRIAVDSGGELTIIDSPAGSSAWLLAAQEAVLPALAAFWLAFVIRQIASFRRSGDERRQQLKWLMSGAAVTMLGGAVVTLVGSLDTHPTAAVDAVTSLGSVVVIALPLSIGVGILKYRLYDIDRIISRTLAYTLVTGLLVGVYAGLVLLATQVLRFHSTVAVAAATLAAAALFHPVRRRVQRAVDRRFNRARYDADQMIAAFAARLQDAVDLAAVRGDLAAVVHTALEPAHLSVWIRDPGASAGRKAPR